MIVEMKDEREFWRYERRRKKIKLSTSGIADAVGVTYPMISMYENNKSNLSPEKQIKYRQFIKEY